MLKSITVFTYELDDPDAAVAEIQAGLEGFELLDSTAGVVFCSSEFVQEGIYAAVAKALPFEVVGATTVGQATNAVSGELMFTLTVLTSRDVVFGTGLSAPISDTEGRADVEMLPAVEQAKEKLGGMPPKLAFIFCPPPHGYPADDYVSAVERLCGEIPVFGSISVDDSRSLEEDAYCFRSGETAQKRGAVLLFAGNINPRFFYATLLDDALLPYSGEITEAQGADVYGINHETALNFFARKGFANEGILDEGLRFLPAFFDVSKLPEGRGVPPYFRSFYMQNPDGSIHCRGAVPNGSLFRLARMDGDGCIQAAQDLVNRVKQQVPNAQAVFMISCIARRMAMGLDTTRGADFYTRQLKDFAPFIFAYGGGEICPLLHEEKRTVNRFQMFTTVVCVL